MEGGSTENRFYVNTSTPLLSLELSTIERKSGWQTFVRHYAKSVLLFTHDSDVATTLKDSNICAASNTAEKRQFPLELYSVTGPLPYFVIYILRPILDTLSGMFSIQAMMDRAVVNESRAAVQVNCSTHYVFLYGKLDYILWCTNSSLERCWDAVLQYALKMLCIF